MGSQDLYSCWIPKLLLLSGDNEAPKPFTGGGRKGIWRVRTYTPSSYDMSPHQTGHQQRLSGESELLPIPGINKAALLFPQLMKYQKRLTNDIWMLCNIWYIHYFHFLKSQKFQSPKHIYKFSEGLWISIIKLNTNIYIYTHTHTELWGEL